MGQETMGKKEKEKKKAKKRQDKEERKEERKANNNKGKSLEAMLAYVDENGNLSAAPPDMSRKVVINQEDIQLGAAKPVAGEEQEVIRKGIVKFFTESKGYGFINDLKTQESIFVHINQLTEQIREGDKVIFEVERGPKGMNAVRVKKGS